MSYYMHDITWPEFQAKKDSVVILPIGATEQHAQHLPLCTDAKIAEKFSCYLAEELDGIIMPTLTYGYKSKPLSGGGPLFPGTIDLNGKVLTCTYEGISILNRGTLIIKDSYEIPFDHPSFLCSFVCFFGCFMLS